VVDRSGKSLLAHRDQLHATPPGKSLLWCAQPLVRVVSPETDPQRARVLMDTYSLDHVPVMSGGLLVGILPRQALNGAASDVCPESSPRFAA
jgi:hypothetical protein